MMVGTDPVAARSPPRGADSAAPASQAKETFAQVLRDKSRAGGDSEEGDDADHNDGGAGNGPGQAPALSGPIGLFPGWSERSLAPGGDAGGDAQTALTEATGSSAAANAAAPAWSMTLAPTADSAESSTWEASVRDGAGVAIDLRAEAAPPGPGQIAAWSVTVVSPSLAAEILARHAPELTDRLRRRGIASHVRIGGLRDAEDEST